MDETEVNISPSEGEFQTILKFLFEIRASGGSENSMQRMLACLNRYFGCVCSSFWMVGDDYCMSDPVGAGINPKLLTDYESGLHNYDEYYIRNLDPQLLADRNVIEYSEDTRINKDSPYYRRLRQEGISHKYAIMLRDKGVIKGSIALFEPISENGGKPQLSPKYLEVVAPFIAQEYLNMQTGNRSEQVASILQTVLNTSDQGIALFNRSNPESIIYYNPICTKYCFDFVDKGHPNTIIGDFIKDVVVPFDRPYPKVKELSMDLPSPTGELYNVRVIDNSDRAGNMCTLFINPKEPGKKGDDRSQSLFTKLTPKEREITLMISQGLTNSEIAESLFISLSTVKSHIQHIFEKASVSNRTSLMAIMSTED